MRDELVTVITRHVTSFITSANTGQRGAHGAAAAHDTANLSETVKMKIPNAFDLAVHDHDKKRREAKPLVNKNARGDAPFSSLCPRTRTPPSRST